MLVRSAVRPVIIIATLTLCVLASNAVAQSELPRTRVLLLYQQLAESEPMQEFSHGLRSVVQDALGSHVEFYQESLDLDRFGGPSYAQSMDKYFEDKYRGVGIDVVVPVGGRALTFALDRLKDVFPGVPIVFALGAAPQTDPSKLPANVTGRIAQASRFLPTLVMARRLQPDAKRIVVIGGAGPSDSGSVAAAVAAVFAMRDTLPLTVIQGRSLDALLREIRQLSPRSIVLFANYRQDGQGQVFEPVDIVGSIAHASSAPMYTQLANYVGQGVVGGSVMRFDDEGARTGELLVRVLRREAGAPLPAIEPVNKSFIADSRQLRRWSLSEKLLPPGTELLFREPTPWERYWVFVLLAIGVIGAELLLIGRLLLEHRRRRLAQMVMEEQRKVADAASRQVAHLGRVALVGELVSTIAHELRQPLAAMRANAETGARFAKRSAKEPTPGDWDLCNEIFTDILVDNVRASDIITRVRALLRREALPQRAVALNDVCREAARLLQHDASTRDAEITVSLDPHGPVVFGDPIQLQQLVLNLAVNALDASMASAARRVVISTRTREEEVEIVVHDTGPGIPSHVRQHLFESFFTTKSEGLGMGLTIVQSIVERHRGRVHVPDDEGAGATFCVVLPRVRHDRIDRASGDGTTLKRAVAARKFAP